MYGGLEIRLMSGNANNTGNCVTIQNLQGIPLGFVVSLSSPMICGRIANDQPAQTSRRRVSDQQVTTTPINFLTTYCTLE